MGKINWSLSKIISILNLILFGKFISGKAFRRKK